MEREKQKREKVGKNENQPSVGESLTLLRSLTQVPKNNLHV